MKRLYRSSRERIIAGVAAGLGEYFDIDPVLIRALFVAGIFLSGASALIYLALWIIMPQKPTTLANSAEGAATGIAEPPTEELPLSAEEIEARKKRTASLIGVGLIALGVIILLDLLLPAFSLKYILPLTLIGVGGFLIWKTLAQPSGSM